MNKCDNEVDWTVAKLRGEECEGESTTTPVALYLSVRDTTELEFTAPTVVTVSGSDFEGAFFTASIDNSEPVLVPNYPESIILSAGSVILVTREEEAKEEPKEEAEEV